MRQDCSVKHIATREPVFTLHVERRSPMNRGNRRTDVRRIRFEYVENSLRELRSLGVPGSRTEIERANFAETVSVCIPGGATLVSFADWMTNSRNGSREGRPCFASS